MLPASSRFRSVRAKFMNDANDKLNCMGAPFQRAIFQVSRIEQSEDTYAPRYTPPEACGALEWGRTCSLDSFDVHS